MPMTQVWMWVGFGIAVTVMLALDLGVFHRRHHAVSMRESLAWSGVWIGVALLFNGAVWHYLGREKAVLFFTAYILEKSLSVDNLFVFLVVFSYFKVPDKHRHSVLFWGVLGALVMRAVFILAGVAIINRFHWVLYLFGGLLVWTGWKMATSHGVQVDPEHNPLLKLVRRFVRVTDGYREGHFFVREGGRRLATPLFVVVLFLEATDVGFAVDSIPAVLAITTDPFIVFTSNILAILGLRSLYFALAHLMGWFRFLHYGLALILAFVGVKMLATDIIHLPPWVALAVVASVLAVAVGLSVAFPARSPGAQSRG